MENTQTGSTISPIRISDKEIAPNKIYDVKGGWSLNYFGTDSSAEQIAYVLYCDKEVTQLSHQQNWCTCLIPQAKQFNKLVY